MDLLTQVHSVASAKEALELLASASSGAVPLYDIILKEHEPQDGANACRLLRKMARAELLAKIPVVCKFMQRRQKLNQIMAGRYSQNIALNNVSKF